MRTLQVSQMWLFAIAESGWSRVDGLGTRTKVGSWWFKVVGRYKSRLSFATVPGAQTIFMVVVSGRLSEVGMYGSATMDPRQVEILIDGLSQLATRNHRGREAQTTWLQVASDSQPKPA